MFSAARCQLRDENGALRGGELLWVVSESRDVPLCPQRKLFFHVSVAHWCRQMLFFSLVSPASLAEAAISCLLLRNHFS